MNLGKICIILARPEENRNIGAVCRAMANNGIADLRIVGRQRDYDEEKIRALAIHAFSIWESTHFFHSITPSMCVLLFFPPFSLRCVKKRLF